jgi:hypothetical protein
MLMTRRGLIRGLFAAPAVVCMANIMPISATWALPRIRGDGIHDDGPGLNALLRGEPVDVLTPLVRECGDKVLLFDGAFRTSETIYLGPETKRLGLAVDWGFDHFGLFALVA